MAGSARHLTPKQTRAVAALLTGKKLSDVAAELGISERTLRAWRQLPGFVAALRAGRQEILDATLGVLLQQAPKAALTLFTLQDCDEPTVRARAALGVLDRVLKAVEVTDLNEQLAELRSRIEELNRGARKHTPRPFRAT
jgi:DNA-binding NarL/FixJ family response regulator